MNDIRIYSIQTYEKSRETLAKKKKKKKKKYREKKINCWEKIKS